MNAPVRTGPLWPKHPAGGGGGGGLRVEDEGLALGSFTGLDFTGGGVTVSIGPGGFAVVNIPTGAGIAAGDGLVEGPPGTVNVGAADATIVVNPDSIRVGIVPVAQVSGATVTAGAGLTGGGALPATLDVGNVDGSIVIGADEIHVAPTIQAGAALGATAVQPARTLFAGAGLTGGGDLSTDRTFNVGNNDGSIVIGADEIHVAAAIQAGAALGLTSVQDVVEMYGPGAGKAQGVTVTPGWTVLTPGGFVFSNALSDAYVQAIFRAVFLVTDASMVGRVRLFDVTAGTAVAASVVSTSSLTDVAVSTGNILGSLVDGHTYQFQAEAVGTAADAAFVFVRSATLICQL